MHKLLARWLANNLFTWWIDTYIIHTCIHGYLNVYIYVCVCVCNVCVCMYHASWYHASRMYCATGASVCKCVASCVSWQSLHGYHIVLILAAQSTISASVWVVLNHFEFFAKCRNIHHGNRLLASHRASNLCTLY